MKTGVLPDSEPVSLCCAGAVVNKGPTSMSETLMSTGLRLTPKLLT